MRILSGLFFLGTLAQAQAQVKHLIIIGVDGLGGAAVQNASTPRIHELMTRGSWTLKARAVIPTVSSPNWASMIMGATVAHHGITSNEWTPSKFELGPVCKGPEGTFPTMFSALRTAKPGMVMGIIHDWDGFGRLVEPNAVNVSQSVKGSKEATDRAIAWWLEKKPELLFLHLDDVDHAGHNKGWWTEDYYAALTIVDALIGNVVDAVERAGLEADTAILVTADHGGLAKSHGGMSTEHVEIPWILAGPGVEKGRELKRPVDTFDTATTVVKLLGGKPHSCWIGKVVTEALVLGSGR